jgi:O-antigen biosynthesis protein WbqP
VKRALDVTLAAVGLLIAAGPMAVIALAIKATSRGDVLHWSRRVGQHNALFLMPKFRTMATGTPQVATHLLSEPQSFLIPIGGFLRKSSLDELPQLWTVLIGDLSLVGPRPALFNQEDLIAARTACGVHTLKPGITGWAQVNGRDELPIPQKVALDDYYRQHRSTAFDLKILALTLARVVRRTGVSH